MNIPSATEVNAVVEETVRNMSEWAKAEFQIRSLPIMLQVTSRRRNFYGLAGVKRDKGRFQTYILKLSIHDFIHYPHVAYPEYRSFGRNPVIGGFETTDWKLGLEALIAHEMSHIVQFALKISALDALATGMEHPLVVDWNGTKPVFAGLGEFEANHGSFFQAIYSRFRTRWINDRVDPSAYTDPYHAFVIPDTFEDRLAEMPSSPLTNVVFYNNGKRLTVVGRNPNRNKLYDYQVRDDNGKFYRCKMSLIVLRSETAKHIVAENPEAAAEWQAHKDAQIAKFNANAKSKATKARRKIMKNKLKEAA